MDNNQNQKFFLQANIVKKVTKKTSLEIMFGAYIR